MWMMERMSKWRMRKSRCFVRERELMARAYSSSALIKHGVKWAKY